MSSTGGWQLKQKRKHDHLGTSLDFAAQLTSHIATRSSRGSGAALGAEHPVDTYQDDNEPTKRLKLRADHKPHQNVKLKLKDISVRAESDETDIARSRSKMETKARVYAAMKRGDSVTGSGESLIDFDRKWAEREHNTGRPHSNNYVDDDDDDDESGDDGADDVIEYEDEFGRLRQGKRSEKEKMERRLLRGALGAEELDRMSARPMAPTRLIHGDVIQTLAFSANDPEKMEELARNRDRSPTPPPQTHYDASREIRTKGVGFYQFSKDEDVRVEEMRALEATRLETELQRQERDEKRTSRQQELERRRKDLESRRAKKLADSFLDNLSTQHA